MKKYSSLESIMDSMTKKQIISELESLEVDFDPLSNKEPLAKQLLDSSEEVDFAPAKDNSWEDLAKSIRKDAAERPKSSKRKMKTYIAKDANYQEAPYGISKDGKRIRYVFGLDTLSIPEQEASSDVFQLEWVKFKTRSDEKTWETLNGVKCRSILQTSDETLQRYLETNRNFNQRYFLYDEGEVSRRALEQRRKRNLIEGAIFNGREDDVVATLTYLDMKAGRGDTFERLYSIIDRNALDEKALKYADNDPDAFLDAMESKAARTIFMINKASKKGHLKVSKDKFEVVWGDNGRQVCKFSRAQNWQEAVLDHVVTPEGKPLFMKLQDMTGVFVI